MSRQKPAHRSRAESGRRAVRAKQSDSHQSPELDTARRGRQASEAVAREHDASVNQLQDEPVRSSSHDQRHQETDADGNVTGPVPALDADYEEDEARRG